MSYKRVLSFVKELVLKHYFGFFGIFHIKIILYFSIQNKETWGTLFDFL